MFLCLCVLAPIFCISVYNRPCRDDYSYGLLTHAVIARGGSLTELVEAVCTWASYTYHSFSGLYTSAIVLSLHPGIWGEKYYGLSTCIILSVIYFDLFWTIYFLNKRFVGRSCLFVFCASAVLTAILVLWLPSAEQGIFWYNGSMNYMPYAFMNFLVLSLLVEVHFSLQTAKGKILLAISMLLSFLISGGNQVTSFANILFLLFFAGYQLSKKKYYPLLPLASACVGFFIMLMAPGTANRQSAFERQGIIQTVIATIVHVKEIAGEWINIVWILYLIILTPAAMEVAQKNRSRFTKRFPLVPVLMSGAVICGMFCVPYLPMGYFGEDRVTNVIWITFMLLTGVVYFLFWGFLAANQYVDISGIRNGRHSRIVCVLVITFALLAMLVCHNGKTMSNSLWALQELRSGVAKGFAEETDARNALFNDPALTEVGVKPIQNRSYLLFRKELPTDPNEWPNDSMGKYYNKKIYLISEEEPE